MCIKKESKYKGNLQKDNSRERVWPRMENWKEGRMKRGMAGRMKHCKEEE
jgi:hypothetical protein